MVKPSALYFNGSVLERRRLGNTGENHDLIGSGFDPITHAAEGYDADGMVTRLHLPSWLR